MTPSSTTPWLAVMVGGAAGAAARYGVGITMARLAPRAALPLGTLTVNAVGCLLFGFVWGLLERTSGAPKVVVLLTLTGFMGAFTTFSTFAFETVGLFQSAGARGAAINLVLHNGLGMLLMVVGLLVGRWVGGALWGA